MISGGVRGVAIVTLERIHSTLHGVQKSNSFFLNRHRLSVQCSVASDGHHELLSSPLLRDTEQSASDLTHGLQHHYLSLKKEGGVQEWRPLDFFVSSRDVPISRQWPITDIAEAADASKETISAEGEQTGTSGSIEENVIVGDKSPSEEGQSSGGFKNLWERIQNIGRQAEVLKEEVTSLDYTVSPTPYTPVEGFAAAKFGGLSLLLLFIFWLGNYYVPDLIFKNTVFRKEPEEEDPLNPTGTTSGDENMTVSNLEPRKGSSEASKISKGDGDSSTIKSGAGFSRNRKQKRAKSAKRR
ncbi:unnamed protein product [Calypogeia fissa]